MLCVYTGLGSNSIHVTGLHNQNTNKTVYPLKLLKEDLRRSQIHSGKESNYSSEIEKVCRKTK